MYRAATALAHVDAQNAPQVEQRRAVVQEGQRPDARRGRIAEQLEGRSQSVDRVQYGPADRPDERRKGDEEQPEGHIPAEQLSRSREKHRQAPRYGGQKIGLRQGRRPGRDPGLGDRR